MSLEVTTRRWAPDATLHLDARERRGVQGRAELWARALLGAYVVDERTPGLRRRGERPIRAEPGEAARVRRRREGAARVSRWGVEPGEAARDRRRRAGATRVSRWAGAGRAREGALPAEGDQFFFGLIIGRRRPGTLEAAGGAVVVAVAGALAVAEGRADTTGFTVAVVVVVVVGLVVTVTVGVAAVALAGALPASVVPDSSFLPQPTTKAADAPRTRARVENERMFMGGA